MEQYKTELASLRETFGPIRSLPAIDFFLFGMGSRQKLIYEAGLLRDGLSGDILNQWDVETEMILPCEYSVNIQTSNGQSIRIVEDESAVWLEKDGQRRSLSSSHIRLPRFTGNKYASVLRVLHHEILISIVDGLPVPNFFVYQKPWYRDGALMAMMLKETGNLDLIRDWILGLREPYDYNNAGEAEADNLGQVLFLISLVSDQTHPLVSIILAELSKYETGNYIKGRTDFAEHPVYQTKWAKFGLTSLGLYDPYQIPALPDTYSKLFWWDYRENQITGPRSNAMDYPYLEWAEAHFDGDTHAPIGDRDYPLTWEANASQAHYPAMEILSPLYVEQNLSAPHTWHAVEMFLYLLEKYG